MSDFDWMDIHVHTAHSCRDSHCPMSVYLDAVRQGRCQGIGFADHMHANTKFINDTLLPGYDTRMFEPNAYCAEIEAAQADGLPVYKGVEATYEPEAAATLHAWLAQNQYDYVIGSVHSIGGMWLSGGDDWRGFNPGRMFNGIVEQYYHSVLQSLRDDAIDVIGHIGVYHRNLPQAHPLMQTTQTVRLQCETALAQACAKSEKIVEVNTSAFGTNVARTMPGVDFLQAYRAAGGQRLALASDAHDIANLNQHFTAVAALLRSLGFARLFYPWAPERPVSL